LACLWGGGLGYCTATVRHYSASILSRMGGSPLKAHGSVLPSYEDPRYGCRMELLRFDSRTPAQRFAPLINQLKSKLATAVAIRRSRVPMWGKFAGELTAEHVGLLRMAPVYY